MFEVRRDDGELCGFVFADDGQWTATTVFGASLGLHAHREDAERQVHADGLSSLAERWTLVDGTSGDEQIACIQESSPERCHRGARLLLATRGSDPCRELRGPGDGTVGAASRLTITGRAMTIVDDLVANPGLYVGVDRVVGTDLVGSARMMMTALPGGNGVALTTTRSSTPRARADSWPHRTHFGRPNARRRDDHGDRRHALRWTRRLARERTRSVRGRTRHHPLPDEGGHRVCPKPDDSTTTGGMADRARRQLPRDLAELTLTT